MNETYEETFPPPEPNGMIHVAYLAIVNHDVGVDIVAVDTGLPVQLLEVVGAREAVWSGNSSHLAVLSVTSSSSSQCCTILVYVCTETIAVSLSHPQWTLIKTIPAPTYSKDHRSWYQYSHLSFSYPLASLTVFQSPNTDYHHHNQQHQHYQEQSGTMSEEETKQQPSNQGSKRKQLKQQQIWSVYDSVFVYNATASSTATNAATATTTGTTTESTATEHHQHQHRQQGRHLSLYRLSRVVLLDVLVGQFDELQLQPPLLMSPHTTAITSALSAPPTPSSSSSSFSSSSGGNGGSSGGSGSSGSSSGGLDGPSLHSVASLTHLVESSTDHQHHHHHDHHHHQRMWVLPLCAPRLSR